MRQRIEACIPALRRYATSAYPSHSVVVSSALHPLSLDGEDVWDILAPGDARHRTGIASGTVSDEMANFCIPLPNRVREGFALLTKPTSRIRTCLGEGRRKLRNCRRKRRCGSLHPLLPQDSRLKLLAHLNKSS